MASEGPTVELILMNAAILEALIARDLDLASKLIGYPIPPSFLNDRWLWELRYDQMLADPASTSWLVRAVIAQPANEIVGHAGFHAQPDERGMVEVGYSILPEHRRHGYARAALNALITYAESHNAKVVRASIRPDNAASLATIAGHGFQQIGEQWDEVDGLELVYERELL